MSATVALGALRARIARGLVPLGAAAADEADRLLAHVLGCSRSSLVAHPERPVAADEIAAVTALAERRGAGEPLAYLTGTRGFWDFDLEVTPATLIPRPETEHLVERALELIPAGLALRVADLGTGSGAVAIAVARERTMATVVATDASAGALAVAERNARRLAPARIELREGDWCEALGAERFALVVSNPPYVRAGDPHLADPALAAEPRMALVPGPGGLEAIEIIARGALARLDAGGWLVLEHGFDQGAAVRAVLAKAGYGEAATTRDLAGRERVTAARTPR